MFATTITAISAEKLDLPLHEPFTIASGAQHYAANVLVKIRLADGTEGFGEAAPFPAVSGETQDSTLDALKHLTPSLLERDVRTWRRLSSVINTEAHAAAAARCALEMAMIDSLCKHYQMPLWAFFGGFNSQLETDMTITSGDEAHAARSAQAILARGIKTIKIKTAGVDIDFDLARLQAIHAVAPHTPLIVDGNCGYDADRALQFVERLRQHSIDLILFEQPLPRDDWEGMARVTRESGVLIAADESARSAADVLRIANESTANVINIKLMKAGINEALRMIAIAKASRLGLMIGGMVESILAMTFSAHLAAGTGGFQFVDLDTPMFITDHPFIGGFMQTGGTLTLSDAPGHGVTLK